MNSLMNSASVGLVSVSEFCLNYFHESGYTCINFLKDICDIKSRFKINF